MRPLVRAILRASGRHVWRPASPAHYRERSQNVGTELLQLYMRMVEHVVWQAIWRQMLAAPDPKETGRPSQNGGKTDIVLCRNSAVPRPRPMDARRHGRGRRQRGKHR